MLPNDESVKKVSKETILSALHDERIANSLSDDVLESIIRNEMDQGEFGMDTQLFDACTQLLWNRHASKTTKQLENSERRSLKRLRRYMRRSAALSLPKRFPLRPIMATAIILLLMMSPVLVKKPSFKIAMPHDEEQYLVVGIQKSDTGIARASINKGTIGAAVELDSLEAIAPHLGYAIELPAWIPDGCSLEKILLDREIEYDHLLVTFTGDENKRITISVTHFDNREGHSASYEQQKRGRHLSLNNGASIYVTSNIDSVWGLYQSAYLDYLIDITGYDEMTLSQIFNSIRR